MNTTTDTTRANPTGKRFWFDSQTFEVLLSSEDTGEQFSMLRQTLAPNYGPPVHVHEREDQALVVLEGSITAQLDPMGESPTEVELTKGESVFLPRNIPHVFRTGADGATLLELNTPGGFEHFHIDAGDEATHDGVPEQRPPDIARMAQCAAEYDCAIIGPPMGV